MKTVIAWFTALMATFALAQEPDDRVILVPLAKAPKEAPLFFSATADVKIQVGQETVTSEQELDFTIHQGKSATLSLALTGTGEVTSVTGENLRDWSVRVAEDGSRFLDVRPVGDDIKQLNLQVRTRLKIEARPIVPLLPGPGAATGFALSIALAADSGVELLVEKAEGLVPVDDSNSRKFLGYGAARLELGTLLAGTGARGIELSGTTVTGRLAADGNSISLKLTSIAKAAAKGSAVQLLGGGAALAGGVSGDGWHVMLRKDDSMQSYDLIAERAGEFPIEVDFIVPVTRSGDWRKLEFYLPSGIVVPVKIEGLGKGVSFDRLLTVVPQPQGDAWRGFLPANGSAAMAWREADALTDGALFFSSTESSDVRIGSGLLRQLTTVDLRVLQGKLATLSISLDGPGEVLAVTGEPVLGWSVIEEAGKRRLDVKLSRPIEGSGRIVIEAQSALGGFPVKAEALRMIPIGSLRHSGWLRVANEGAVRIEVAEAKGLIQLAPGQFPGGVDESLRQVFVYRFPSSDYNYAIQADQVLPEIAVTEVTVYELAETDRRIFADLELDIREAPLREWELEIPADHAVASVTGAAVADYAVASEIKDGKRRLKIIFKEAVMNRQLVSVRLEKNEAAKAGAWNLQPLGFPGVKSRRGYVGAVAAAGYRLVAGTDDRSCRGADHVFSEEDRRAATSVPAARRCLAGRPHRRGPRPKRAGRCFPSLLAESRGRVWQRVDQLLRRRRACHRVEDFRSRRHRQHRRHRPERRSRLAARWKHGDCSSITSGARHRHRAAHLRATDERPWWRTNTRRGPAPRRAGRARLRAGRQSASGEVRQAR